MILSVFVRHFKDTNVSISYVMQQDNTPSHSCTMSALKCYYHCIDWNLQIPQGSQQRSQYCLCSPREFTLFTCSECSMTALLWRAVTWQCCSSQRRRYTSTHYSLVLSNFQFVTVCVYSDKSYLLKVIYY